MRVLLMLVLIGAALSGCATPEEGPRLAQPTDAPAKVPWPEPTEAPPETPDFDDPGYVTNWSWRKGDGWDYLSNTTKFRQVRVEDERDVDGHRHVLVVLTEGNVGKRPRSHLERWINTSDMTYEAAAYRVSPPHNFSYSPAARDLGFHHNGSYSFNETTHDGKLASIRANVWYRGTERVEMNWGTVETGRLEHRIARTVPGAGTTLLLVVHYPSDEIGNDVLLHEADGTVFRLTAFEYGGRSLGELS